MTWAEVPLRDLVQIEIGRTPARDNPAYWMNGEGYPWLSISDMNQGRNIVSTKETITAKAIRECNCKLVPAGTLLLSFKLSIGKVGFNSVPLYTNEAIAALHILSEKKIFGPYLFWALQHIDLLQYVDTAAKGKTLNKRKLNEVTIPLPPLPEQRRIAAVLDAADGLRAKRRAALARLDALLQSVFLEMFGDPVRNERGWEQKSLGDIGEVITGNTPSRGKLEYYGTHIEWIKSDNINSPSMYLTTAEEGLSALGAKVGRVVPAGSILVTCIAGSPNSIGNAAIANRAVAFNQQINALVPSTKYDTLFLYVHFLVGKKLVQQASTNSMKGMVNKSAFSAIQFIDPPYELQQTFSSWSMKVQEIRNAQNRQADELDGLFQSLQQLAFGGVV